MSTALNLKGQRFGRLVAIAKEENKKGDGVARWKCACDCGNVAIVRAQTLRRGDTRSCGCLRTKVLRERSIHGQSKTREYEAWQNMMKRCYDKKNKSFKHYGGRDIRVCKRWHRFENFLKDMGRKNKPNFTLERINNNKGYSPKNCVWASRSKQNRNKRIPRNKTSKYRGVSLCKRRGKWKAIIGFERERKHIGYFNSEREAARAYNKEAIKLWGPGMWVNKL